MNLADVHISPLVNAHVDLCVHAYVINLRGEGVKGEIPVKLMTLIRIQVSGA